MPKVKFKDLCKIMLKGKESTDKQLTNDSSEKIHRPTTYICSIISYICSII